jgi:hypothetical protein
VRLGERGADARRHHRADVVHLEQLRLARVHHPVERTEVRRQVLRRRLAFGLAGAKVKDSGQRAVVAQAGSALRRMREAAGMTLGDVAKAMDLSDPTLLEAAEGGRTARPFEVVLRLGGVLGRSDPLTATMKLARAYNPELWRALDALGVGKLVVQAGGERELANI